MADDQFWLAKYRESLKREVRFIGRIKSVKELHHKDDAGVRCAECGKSFPCPTFVAVGEGVESSKEERPVSLGFHM